MMGVDDGLRYLDWDSTFFDMKIARLTRCDNVSLALDMSVFDIIQAKVDAAEYEKLDLLVRSGFVLAESEIDYVKNVTGVDSGVLDEAHFATENDLSQVASISQSAFAFSRFRKPWYSEDKKNELYKVWASKAVLGQFDDVCLVTRVDGRVSGYITVKLNGSDSRVGLLAVDSSFQGMGIGRQLVALAEVFSAKNNAERLLIATQMSNRSAMSLYSRAGYGVDSTSYWFYWAK